MTKKTRLFIGLGSAVVLIGAYLLTVAFLGAETGQPCDKEWGCKGMEAVCIEGDAPFCSIPCEADEQCPPDWSCADVKVYNIDGKSGDVDETAAPMCLPPR